MADSIQRSHRSTATSRTSVGDDWAAPARRGGARLRERPRALVGTLLYGRRMEDVMITWETMPPRAEPPPSSALRRGLAGGRVKLVYSTTLRNRAQAPEHGSSASSKPRASGRSRQRRHQRGRSQPSRGPTMRIRLVNELLALFLTSRSVGGSRTPSLPHDVRLELELLTETPVRRRACREGPLRSDGRGNSTDERLTSTLSSPSGTIARRRSRSFGHGIKAAAPEAKETETISYRMPAFKDHSQILVSRSLRGPLGLPSKRQAR